MKTTAHLAIAVVAIAASPARTGHAATQQQIGAWVLNCPGDKPGIASCTLRLEKRFLDKAGITGDLEVQAQGKTLVPVITLRGLPSKVLMAASLASKTDASVQFGRGPREDLTCESTSAVYICAPNGLAGPRLAAGLPDARSVTVRVNVSMTGMSPLPEQEETLDLSGTNEALAKLRAAGPAQAPSLMTELESRSPAGWMGMADRLLKAAGYPNGIAQIQAWLAKYLKALR
jgi:hypothetical protein